METEKKTPEPNSGSEENEVERGEEVEEPPSHLPFAPPSSSEPGPESELIDNSTTVDPSYVISQIRQLLPQSDKQTPATNEETSEQERPWEEAGCILWDLAAAEIQAQLMVDNFILDVLLANLHASTSPRIQEICLGILGNLSCHESLATKLTSKEGLVETVVQQLFLDDSCCLTEAFRLLKAAVQTNAYALWSEALVSEEVLQRVLWIVENTLNTSLFEKCINFLLAVIDDDDVARILLGPLMKLGLPDIAVNLLTTEVEKSGDDIMLERTGVLDNAIRLVEGLSAVDDFVKTISFKEKLIQCLCKILKASDKFEISESCSSAVLILANLLADQNLVSVLASDFPILEGLFDTLPVVADDDEARIAVWFIMSKVLGEAVKSFCKESLNRIAELMLDKIVLIEESMSVQFLEQLWTSNYVGVRRVASIARIVEIIEKWLGDESLSRQSSAVERAHRLLKSCSKYMYF